MTKTYDKLMTELATSTKPGQMFEQILVYPRMSPTTSVSVLMEYLFQQKHADGQAADVYGTHYESETRNGE